MIWHQPSFNLPPIPTSSSWQSGYDAIIRDVNSRASSRSLHFFNIFIFPFPSIPPSSQLHFILPFGSCSLPLVKSFWRFMENRRRRREREMNMWLSQDHSLFPSVWLFFPIRSFIHHSHLSCLSGQWVWFDGLDRLVVLKTKLLCTSLVGDGGLID